MSVSETPLDLEVLLRRIIREETGVTSVVPADKWRGGMLVLRPGTTGLQEKSWPIETFFHKVFAASPACIGAVSNVVPVDLVISGCPPTPTQLLQGLLALLSAR